MGMRMESLWNRVNWTKYHYINKLIKIFFLSTVLFTWRRCFDHLWTKFARSFVCSFRHFRNDRDLSAHFFERTFICGLLFFSNLREGVFLLGCLVASKVAQATGSHVVYSPRQLFTCFTHFLCISHLYWCLAANLCPFPTLLEAPKLGDFTSTQIHLMKACQRFQSKIWFESFLKFYTRQIQNICESNLLS